MAHPGKQSAMAKANKALALASKLQASREKKFLVSSLVQSGDNVGHLLVMNAMDQGLGDSDRVGDRITCAHLRADLWRVIPGSATGRFSLRFLFIIDKQNTITSVDQVFLGTGSNICPFNQFVKDYRKQFVVLYDSGANHMDQYNKGDTVRINRKIQLRTQFQAASATILTGSIKLVILTNQGENSNSKPILIGSVRVDYTDA
jgi:hypothetical protein